jgi:Putative adhesin
MTAPQTCLAPRAPETKRVARRRAPVTLAVGGVLAVGLVASSAYAGLGMHEGTSAAASAGMPTALAIQVDSASVTLVTGAVDRPTFTYRAPWPATDQAFTQTVSGDTLTARFNTRTSPVMLWWSTGGSLLVTLPASGTISRLTIQGETCSMQVSVPAGTATITTGTGSVTVTGAVAALDANTGTGTMTVRTDGARTVKASTGTGSLALHLTGTPPTLVDAETGTGSILVELPTGRYAVEADAGTGDVANSLIKDDTSGHVVKASIGTGSIALRQA